jgi:murein DD-endopeptidase MepM/ murein hydrolase activator NlpD
VDKYYTLMIIPEKEKTVKSFRIPAFIFKSLAFLTVVTTILFAVLLFNYIKILNQVYENKHLNIENRQLREQIQLFQMKLNTISNDLERINTFEKKLRIITGLEKEKMYQPAYPSDSGSKMMHKENEGGATQGKVNPDQSSYFNELKKIENDFEEEEKFLELKTLYEQKIANTFGISDSYQLNKRWSELSRKSFDLAMDFASFDYKYNLIKDYIGQMEVDIHTLDQHLLDKESILNSTPTILPTLGWITSYFGQRISPYSGRLRMHEGIDVGASFGTDIVASADGVVTFSGKKPGFGMFVQVDHGYGIETLYAHAQRTLVQSGQKVKRGDVVAHVGSTGYSTGPHLHYEVRVNGIAVDPFYFVLQ